jgi:hypothetical protein
LGFYSVSRFLALLLTALFDSASISGWIKMALIKDSRGHSSWHLTLAIPATIAITLSFLVGGTSLSFGEWNVTFATRNGSDFLLMLAPWLAAMGFREYQEKLLDANATPTVSTAIGFQTSGTDTNDPA